MIETLLVRHIRTVKPGDPLRIPLLTEVRTMLQWLMRSRALIEQPPSLLGYGDHASWNADALLTLAFEAYQFAILDRLTSLRAYGERPDVAWDPLRIKWTVRRNLANFLTERQRDHDPIGWGTFQNLKAAIQLLARDQRVSLVFGDSGCLDNATVVHFGAAPVGEDRLSRQELMDCRAFTVACSELAGDLDRVRGKTQEALAGALMVLADARVTAVSVGTLANELKRLARQQRQQLDPLQDGQTVVPQKGSDEDSLEYVVAVAPNDPPTSEDSELAASLLSDHLCQTIDAADMQTRTRAGLHRLLDEIRAWARDDHDGTPSVTDLTQRTGLARSTVQDLLTRLRELARASNPDAPKKSSLSRTYRPSLRTGRPQREPGTG